MLKEIRKMVDRILNGDTTINVTDIVKFIKIKNRINEDR